MHNPAIDIGFLLDSLMGVQHLYVQRIKMLERLLPDSELPKFPVPELAQPLSVDGVEGHVKIDHTMELQLPDGSWAKMALKNIKLRACRTE